MLALHEFVRSNIRNSYVEHPEFSTLYVRHASHVVEGQLMQTFDIASIRACRPGTGAFRRLVEFLLESQERPIYVESVHNDVFGKQLHKMGFKPIEPQEMFSYVLFHDEYIWRRQLMTYALQCECAPHPDEVLSEVLPDWKIVMEENRLQSGER